MSRGVDTAVSLILGFLGVTVAYLAYHGLTNLAFPPLWISLAVILFLSTASVTLEPSISGNLILDSLLSGTIIYSAGLVLITGMKVLPNHLPQLNTFLTLSLILSLLIRGYLWAEEEVEFEL